MINFLWWAAIADYEDDEEDEEDEEDWITKI